MKVMRCICISLLAIFMVIGISLGSASAFDTKDWQGAWFKIKASFRVVCGEIDGSDKLLKDSEKEPAWIYIDQVNEGGAVSYLVIKDNGVWKALTVPLILWLGSGKDVVYATNDIVGFESDGNQIEIDYFIRLTAKKGKLKKATLQNVAGLIFITTTDVECTGTLIITGKYAKKVPDAVQNAEGLPED